MLDQAIPTPTIEPSSAYLLWGMATDKRPRAPASKHRECAFFRPTARASAGSRGANAKHTTEYIAKQIPPHSTPAWYSGERSSGAPNTLRATATGKYSHMQKRPAQVQTCTQASRFIVSG